MLPHYAICMLGNFVCLVWIQIRSNVLSGPILVQTICKGYQQMTPVGKKLSVIAKLPHIISCWVILHVFAIMLILYFTKSTLLQNFFGIPVP